LAKIEKDFLPALKNYKEALTIVEKFNDQQRIAMILNNIGKIYYESGNFIRSETNLKKALNICENNQLLYQKANILRDLGLLYKNKGLFEEALYYFNLSLNITIPNNYKYYTRYAYQYMADIFEKTKQFEKAYQYYKLAVQIKDTLLNEEKYKAIAELETKYQTREKETEIKLLNQQNELNKTKIKQANTIILFISLGITFIIIFLVIVFKQYNDKRKANIKLEEQNQLILKQKQDITDSITYASRIQSALMPTSEYLNQLLKDYFIIYKPKDIVSGDFYWISEQNNKIILVVADCTGHGVPGAFMSMLGNAFLNEITSGNDEIHTDEILNELRRNIIKSLHQNIDIQEHKDGMDAVVMIIDYKNLNLEFSGAYNPLIICRGNKIIELKGDRMPVGVHYFSDKLFTRQSIKIKSGDCIYAFSDGFQDQFGGEHLQKFMLKRMKDMFLEINNLSMDEQMSFIIKTHEEWKRNNPQIDDILLVGLKI
jgi:serine phosphatase RsbU (regulator of sigma subunit)